MVNPSKIMGLVETTILEAYAVEVTFSALARIVFVSPIYLPNPGTVWIGALYGALILDSSSFVNCSATIDR